MTRSNVRFCAPAQQTFEIDLIGKSGGASAGHQNRRSQAGVFPASKKVRSWPGSSRKPQIKAERWPLSCAKKSGAESFAAELETAST